jgi:hypothetical protein
MAIARISPPPAPPPTLSPPVSRRQSTIPLVSPGIPSRLWLPQDCSIKTLAPYSGNSIKTLAPYFGWLLACSLLSEIWTPSVVATISTTYGTPTFTSSPDPFVAFLNMSLAPPSWRTPRGTYFLVITYGQPFAKI